MTPLNRRRFLRTASTGLMTGLAANGSRGFCAISPSIAQEVGNRPPKPTDGVRVINPRGRVPVSLIIDDSTCLVNLAHFCIPQFHEVFPSQYLQPWKTLPREIPDAFVRRFGEWCADRGIKGKYSLIPHPACVGWLDRDLPGWSKAELRASIELVRAVMVPNWDIHPEMISHTWAIDTKAGRPFPTRTSAFMENWGFSSGKSADELADYMSYALEILRNVGINCEGITTPGGFGTRVLPALAQGTLEACRAVFHAEIPHYFRHIFIDGQSVAPRVEYASGLDGPDPKCVVSIIGCTGDWFGGWDGLSAGSVDQFITADLKHGRLPEVIARGEPAIMVCHWPGLYFNGQEVGFRIFQEVVRRLHDAYDGLIWMKLSEIARYWSARELTPIERKGPGQLSFRAPFACPQFTVQLELPAAGRATVTFCTPRGAVLEQRPLSSVASLAHIRAGAFHLEAGKLVVCLDLPKGASRLELSSE